MLTCGQRQTLNHIVDRCPLTKFEGGLNLHHEADDYAVIWLESTATAVLLCSFAVLGPTVDHTKDVLSPFISVLCHTIRDTRCYFNVRSKADISQLNLPHGSLICRSV